MHVEGERVSHVGQSTKMKIREYKAKNKLLGRVQPDKSVTIKSILYYNAAHVFIIVLGFIVEGMCLRGA